MGIFLMFFWNLCELCEKKSFIMQKQRKNSIIFVASATIILFLHNYSNIYL